MHATCMHARDEGPICMNVCIFPENTNNCCRTYLAFHFCQTHLALSDISCILLCRTYLVGTGPSLSDFVQSSPLVGIGMALYLCIERVYCVIKCSMFLFIVFNQYRIRLCRISIDMQLYEIKKKQKRIVFCKKTLKIRSTIRKSITEL